MILYGSKQMQTVRHKASVKKNKLRYRSDAEKHMTYYRDKIKAYMDTHNSLQSKITDRKCSLPLSIEKSIEHIHLPSPRVFDANVYSS